MEVRAEFIRDLATMSEQDLLEQARSLGCLKESESDPLCRNYISGKSTSWPLSPSGGSLA